LPTARFDDIPVAPAARVPAPPPNSEAVPLAEPAPPTSAPPNASAAPTLAERTAFAERVARIGALMSQLERREGSVFDQLAERYAKLAQFTAVLERREEVAFDERASRFMRLVDFARRLRLEQERTESEDFEQHLGRALKAQAFMKRLSAERAALRIPVPNTLAPEPEEWIR
jgi:hypothetical protein